MNPNDQQNKLYFKYWGKARAKEGVGPAYHLLPYHCLDVAAVAELLLDRHPHLLKIIAANTGIDFKHIKPLLIFILLLHDLGKFSESFQNLVPELLDKLQGITNSQKAPYIKKAFAHDSIGYLVWNDSVFEFIAERLRIENSEDWRDLLNILMQASHGHHGLPPKVNQAALYDYYSDQDLTATKQFITEILKFILIQEIFKEIDLDECYDALEESLKQCSWILAGFFVLCDWLGSGSDFEYCQDNTIFLEDYWNNTAKTTALKAIEKAGILPCTANDCFDPLKQLLDLPENSELTPLQQLTERLSITKTPQLFIIEDETGAGKTEASLMLLNRLMAEGLADAFYLALPTMATADGIFPRIQKTYENLFKPGQLPSLILSHSSAKLSNRFTETILYSNQTGESQKYGNDAQSTCQAWLADNRKKSLLAHAGVGTIDQAFLAVLKVKYQSLRLLGLLGKVLIVDEAHAYDAYMGKELEVLLETHARMGGSAIIMSATLPLATRQTLTDSFSKGLGIKKWSLREDKAYPLITQLSKEGLTETFCAFNPRNEHKTVHYQLIHDETIIDKLIDDSLQNNQCICWIRNSVKDARDTYSKYRQLGKTVTLFHARFPLGQRNIIQNEVLKTFDKDSTHELRKSKLVIATQVVEQSLDLDFDVMITDLAPIDLLIQRAGRLHRHVRDQQGNPKTAGEDEREPAILTIYSPEFVEHPNSNWFADKFPNAKKVYSNHARLWLSARALNNQQQHIFPKNTRNLIEVVYGNQCVIPDGLLATDSRDLGNHHAERSHAAFNTIDFKRGYTMDGQAWADELNMPTRLGEETVTIILARWQDNVLTPMVETEDKPWRQSEIRVLKKHVSEINLNNKQQQAFDAIKKQLPAQGKFSQILPMIWNEQENYWEGEVTNEKKQQTKIFYHLEIGLMYAYELAETINTADLEGDNLI